MTCKDCLYCKHCHLSHSYDRFGDPEWIIKDADECNDFRNKSRFIELPCKVGDTVYAISTEKPSLIPFGKIVDGKLNSFHITENGIFASGVGSYRNISEFSKTVFLTREEAEKALNDRASR